MTAETATRARDWTAYPCECGHGGCTSYRIRGLDESDGAYEASDAHLIAASPDLIASLRFIADRIEGNEHGDDASRPFEDPIYGALHLAQHARAAIEAAS